MITLKLIVMWVLVSAFMFSTTAAAVVKKPKHSQRIMCILYFVLIFLASFWKV